MAMAMAKKKSSFGFLWSCCCSLVRGALNTMKASASFLRGCCRSPLPGTCKTMQSSAGFLLSSCVPLFRGTWNMMEYEFQKGSFPLLSFCSHSSNDKEIYWIFREYYRQCRSLIKICKIVDGSCNKVAHKVCSNHHGQTEVAVLLVSLLQHKYSYSCWRSTQLCKLGNDRSFCWKKKKNR